MRSYAFTIAATLLCLARRSRARVQTPIRDNSHELLALHRAELRAYKDLFHKDLFHKDLFHKDLFHKDLFHKDRLDRCHKSAILRPHVLLQGAQDAGSCFILKMDRHTSRQVVDQVAEVLEKVGARVEGSIRDLLKAHTVCFDSSADAPIALINAIRCVERVELDQRVTIGNWAKDRVLPKQLQHKSVQVNAKVKVKVNAAVNATVNDAVNTNIHPQINTPTNATVNVYVVDTGIWTRHSEFNGTARLGYSLFNNRFGDDCNGHGTQVASLIGGKTVGIAPGVRLVGVQAMDCDGSGTVSNILKALDWVKVNAERPAVVNMSFNGAKSEILDDAINALIDFGITVVAAAGNKACDACSMSPSDAHKVIIVGASDKDDRRAAFSNYGKCITLFAPGCNIVAASVPFTPKSFCAAGGQFVDKLARAVSPSHPQDRYVMTSGTSLAAPFVSGSIALLLSKNASMTPGEVRERLLNGSQWNALQNDTLNNSPNLLLQLPCLC